MDGRVIMDRALLFLYAETPVHVGADTSIGALDLPIQREVSTGLPIIKAESLKGALRERFRPARDQRADRERWVKLFGAEPPLPGTRSAGLRPGTLRVHEAQLVAFPAPALSGTFVWVTSPLARARLERKARLAEVTGALNPEARSAAGAGSAAGGSEPAAEGTALSASPAGSRCLTAGYQAGKFVLGPYEVTVSRDLEVADWARHLGEVALPTLPEYEYFKTKLATDLFACSDDLLGAISRDCAPVAARVQLGTGEEGSAPRKTVQHGPFYSEYLPAESLLAALVECDHSDDLDYVRDGLDNKILRIGGDETLGKGLLWCRVLRAAETQHDNYSERTMAGAVR
jgi:CRISPR-associated protein Cmr4